MATIKNLLAQTITPILVNVSTTFVLLTLVAGFLIATAVLSPAILLGCIVFFIFTSLISLTRDKNSSGTIKSMLYRPVEFSKKVSTIYKELISIREYELNNNVNF